MTKSIDLNADLGEGDPYDEVLLDLVSSCNVACGGHAGNKASMVATVRAAIANDCAVGAHPSYPDREGFGRRSGFMRGAALRHSLLEQVVALNEVALSLGTHVSHVKPHGALYNDAFDDDELADIIADAAAALDHETHLVGQAGSAMERAAERHGLPFVAEAFIDRAYANDGRLVPRGEPGSVLTALNDVIEQAVSLAAEGQVRSKSGETIDVRAETLCVHADTPGAADIARAVNAALVSRGLEVRAVGK